MNRIHLDFSDVPYYLDLLEHLGYSSDIEEADLEDETLYTDNEFWNDCKSVGGYEYLIFNVGKNQYVVHRELEEEMVEVVDSLLDKPNLICDTIFRLGNDRAKANKPESY